MAYDFADVVRLRAVHDRRLAPISWKSLRCESRLCESDSKAYQQMLRSNWTQPLVIGHGILAGKYLAEYHDSLK